MPNVTATSPISVFWKGFSALLLLLLLGLGACSAPLYQTHGDRSEPVIALTFDDGPNPPYTRLFTRVLKKHGVRGTFFFIGRNIELHPLAAQEVLVAGHEIGNHTYSHTALTWKMPHTVAREVELTDSLIRAMGYAGPIPFRPPYGRWLGLHTPVLWWMERTSVLYGVAPSPPDFLRAPPEAIAQSSVRRTEAGSILLFHDGEGIRVEAVEALDRTIGRLKKLGWKFVTVSELLARPGHLP